MTRMMMPCFCAASAMRLPSLRKTSGLGYRSSGMSFGRMNCPIAVYRPLRVGVEIESAVYSPIIRT